MTSGSNAGRELILHHDDLDGAASAAIIQFVESRLGHKNDIVARPISYGESVHAVLDEVGDKYTSVFVLDWSPQGGGGIESLYARLGERLIWIDHHLGAIRGHMTDDVSSGEGIFGLRMSEFGGYPIAACELSWLYAMKFLSIEIPSMPRWLTLIGDWDTWRHAKIPNSVAPEFKLYFDQFGIDAMRDHIVHLLEATVHVTGCGVAVDRYADEEIVSKGVLMGTTFRKFEQNQDAELMRSRGFSGTFAGIPAIMANFEHRGSMRFESMYDPGKHQIMVGFAYGQTGCWTVSMYSNDPSLDCGELCHRLGNSGPLPSGGGHRGAAGFQTDWAYLSTLIQRADGKPVC